MSILGTPAVAKKSGNRSPDKWKSKPIVLQVRGTLDYKAWLERVAEVDGTTVAALADRAIRRYAREIGVLEPPPKR